MNHADYRNDIAKNIQNILVYKQATFSDKVASITDYVIQLLDSSAEGSINLSVDALPESDECIEYKVITIIANQIGINRDVIKKYHCIETDLGGDSLDFIEIIIKLEDTFQINLDDSPLVKEGVVAITIENIINEVLKLKQNV